MSKTGKIFFAGAGPGDPSLLTLRALELIRKSDVVSFDCFVSEKVKERIPGSAEVHGTMRKNTGDASRQPGEMMQPLIEAARAGKTIVRLKGGDPWVFGRGDLEVRACAEAGVPFEVVGGVTAATACFSAFGVPLTEKKISDCLEIRSANGPDPAGDATPGNKTIVYMMADRQPDVLVSKLLERGFPADTPACIIMRGTLEDQEAALLAQLIAACKEKPS